MEQKNCCPTCGHIFDDINNLPHSFNCPICKEKLIKDDLISEDDDYTWAY